MKPQDRLDEDSHSAPFGYQPAVTLCVAFAMGIVLDRNAPRPIGFWVASSLTLLGIWFPAWIWSHRAIGTVTLFGAVAAIGGAWHHAYWSLYRNDDIGLRATELATPVCIEVIASSSPRWLPPPPADPMSSIPQTDETEFDVIAVRLRNGHSWQNVSGKSLLRIRGKIAHINCGDRLRAFALLYAPSQPRNPGEFNFADHDRSFRRLCRLNAESADAITVLSKGNLLQWERGLSFLREQGFSILRRHVDPSELQLAAALILGNREPLDHATTESFFTTGVIHLLSISGLHVGILAYGFWWMARWSPLPRRVTLGFAASLVIFYAVLTGGQAPVVRAAVLVVCVCLAKGFGRKGFALNTLAVAAIFVLALNPCALFQTGAQLSFLAVATLSSVRIPGPGQNDHDPLTQLLERSRPWPIRLFRYTARSATQMFLISLWVWLVTLPLVWWRFHLISPIALLLNPIIIPPTTVALYAGFFVLLIGALIPPLAEASGWICGKCLAFIQFCIDQSLLLKGNHLWAPAPSALWVLGFYLILATMILFPNWRPPKLWRFPLLLLLVSSGIISSHRDIWPLRKFQQDGVLRCTCVAVGHGTAVLVELPNGKTLLYDAGRLGPQTTAVRPIAEVLWSRGLNHLDAVVLSHADTDHYNAVPQLLRRFSVGVIYVSPVMFRGESAALTLLKSTIEQSRTPLQTIHSDDQLSISRDVTIRVLHPQRNGIRGSDNANSIVLLIEFVGRKILLTGDLEGAGLDEVMSEEPLDVDIVLVPHHGSRLSRPYDFSRWATAEWAVISGSRKTDVTQVRDAYRQAGARVFHTADDGAIRFTIDSNEIRAATWRGTGW